MLRSKLDLGAALDEHTRGENKPNLIPEGIHAKEFDTARFLIGQWMAEGIIFEVDGEKKSDRPRDDLPVEK